jgi:hypothetical protein
LMNFCVGTRGIYAFLNRAFCGQNAKCRQQKFRNQ